MLLSLRPRSSCSIRAPSAARAVPAAAPRAAAAPSVPHRALNIHEYQSQRLMALNGITVPAGIAAQSPQKAFEAAQHLRANGVVVKAQVLAGGRGKGHFKNGFKGGVHLCNTPEEARDLAEKMLGQTLVTIQTGEEGKPCNTVFITEQVKVAAEKYIAILLDRASAGPVLIASHRGGMNIEDVAHSNPEDITRLKLDIDKPITSEQATKLAADLRFSPALQSEAAKQIIALYELFRSKDATMIEVNPFAETADKRVMCLDAKLNFDDNAAFRQAEVFSLRDLTQEDSREVAAAQWDLNFIGLSGNIGCLVNGAGLAMATMDEIQHLGGSPANFLDVGGNATEQRIIEAFRILQSDKNVQAIFVNIFGGIMRCDVVALGIIKAASQLGLKMPLVVRLAGTNYREAKALMEESGFKIIPADDMHEGAEKAVNISRIITMAKGIDLDVTFDIPL